MFHLTPFGLSGLLTGVSSLAFGIFVYLKSADRKLGRIWCLFTLSVAGWGFGGFGASSAADSTLALPAWRMTHAFGVIWIANLFYHFVCTFCEIQRRRSILVHYLIGLGFFLTIPTPVLVRGVRLAFDSIFFVDPGPLYFIFFFWWTGLVFYSHYVLIRCYRAVSAHKKNQIKHFFLATTVGFSGGSLCFLPVFKIDVYPWGNFSVPLYPFIMAYAILRHHLMDITFVIRKTLVYSVVTSALATLYLSVAFLTARLVEGWIGSKVAFSYGIAAFMVVVLFNPVLARVQRLVDERFFRSSVRRDEKLLEFSNAMLRQKTPGDLAGLLVRVLEEALHPKRLALYLRRPEGKEFQLASVAAERIEAARSDGNLWSLYFNYYPQPLLHNLLTSYAGSPQADLLEAVSAEMLRLEMAAAFPLLSQNGLLGYLLLGEKKSEQPYTNDDLLLLRNAVNQTALAYERYLLDKGLQEAPEALKTLTSRFVHEIKTPMSNIHMPAAVLLTYVEALKSGKCSLADVLPQLEKQLAYIRDQSLAASEKIEAIRQMSKQQKDDYAPLAADELIRASLLGLDQLISRANVRLMVDVPEHLPPLLGHRQQMEIVFMNLAKNGIEAMMQDKGISRPKILRVEGREEGNFIVMMVEDAGPGIAPENVNHLFQAYFSTKGSEGTGVGLFLAQEVIKAHGGTIEVRSEVGKGTAFIVRLPKYREAAA